MSDNVNFLVSPNVANDDLNALFGAAWPEHITSEFVAQLTHSLAYICAYSRGRLIGFVNLAWDGGVHAFVLDTTVHPDFQRRGIGTRLLTEAIDVAQARGVHWLHVDFEPELRRFYQAAGFRTTEAGLLRVAPEIATELASAGRDSRVPHPPGHVRIMAVDWSGARDGGQQKTWLAEVVDGTLVRLENGRDRSHIAEHIIAEAIRDPRIVVGLDFAFSFPSWFLNQRRLSTAAALWALAETSGEQWLATCEPPFWGRAGKTRPKDTPEEFRYTERDIPRSHRARPKSVFQINGAGAVGTGTIRGMPLLKSLKAAGFSIWPFDPPGWPRVVEIYPRALTGSVNKSERVARETYMWTHFAHVEHVLRVTASSTEDAFDAAVSALVMARHIDDLIALEQTADDRVRLEGKIWVPT